MISIKMKNVKDSIDVNKVNNLLKDKTEQVNYLSDNNSFEILCGKFENIANINKSDDMIIDVTFKKMLSSNKEKYLGQIKRIFDILSEIEED